jgi:delta 1-pyrroline-5-carboxylate dehydrogenase
MGETTIGEAIMETGELGNMWTDGAKKAMELYVESGEKMGKMMLELHERSTTWAKETMLAPLFEAQRNAGKQMMESSMEMTRKLCGIGKNGL